MIRYCNTKSEKEGVKVESMKRLIQESQAKKSGIDKSKCVSFARGISKGKVKSVKIYIGSELLNQANIKDGDIVNMFFGLEDDFACIKKTVEGEGNKLTCNPKHKSRSSVAFSFVPGMPCPKDEMVHVTNVEIERDSRIVFELPQGMFDYLEEKNNE